MLPLLAAMVCCISPTLAQPLPNDTLDIRSLSRAPALDGRISAAEYGADPTLAITAPAGHVRIWLARHSNYMYVAVELPDSTYYWGDDIVISLDTDGSGGSGPAHGDRQWYLRRSLDSSFVSLVTPTGGSWTAAGREQKPLGTTRSTAEWDLASVSSAEGWSIELRVHESVAMSTGVAARIAFRTFNDDPQGWWSWPLPPDGRPAHHVERVPALWQPIRFR